MALLNQPITVGSVALPNRVLLAPLAGVSDVPFRRICRELGAGLTFVEMLNANAVMHGQRRTMRALSRHPSESILGVQVTGPTAASVAEAVERLDREGFDLVDINMGCPVRKIVARGSGSGILKDPERLEDTVRLSRAATNKPLSVKVRLGFTREHINVEQTAEIVARHRVDMFTVHGRTRSENYGAQVDLDGIRLGLDAARAAHDGDLVTVGNGDILQPRAAQTMVQKTGCDAVMVSRGALGNPWIFRLILDPREQEPTTREWLDVVLRHLDYHEAFYGDDKFAVVRMRKHLLWYANGYPDVRRFRERLSVVESLDAARAALRSYVASVPPNLRRYEPYDHGAQPHRPPSRYDPKYEMDRVVDRGVANEED
jgi:nifR3 family TIM-barrel protein